MQNNPLSGVHNGKAAALAVLAEFSKRKLLSVDHMMAGRERGAVLASEEFDRDGKATTCSDCWCIRSATTGFVRAGSTIRIKP